METATLPIVHPKLAGCDGQGGCGPDCVYRKMAEADPEKRQHFARLLAEQNAPGFLRRAGNFARAATQHLIAGRPEVDAPTKAARLAACETCPTHFVPEKRQCNHPSCGCNLDAKAGWADQDCPIGRWWPPVRKPVITIEDTADGIGDAILGLTVVAAVKAANPEAEIVYSLLGEGRRGKPNLAPWVQLFGGYDELSLAPARPGGTVYRPHDSYGRQMAEQTKRPRWEYYAEACGGVQPILPPVRPLPAEAASWAEPYRGAIILAPWSGFHRHGAPWWSYNNRIWPREKWLCLERVLQRAGHRVIVIDDQPHDGRSRDFSEVVVEPPMRVAALMQAAGCAVGNDSGMMHLAGALGTPAVALCSLIPGEKLFGIYPSVRVINGPLGCTGCHWRGPNWRAACDTVCASLTAIQPEDVALAVQEQIERLPALPPHIAAFINRLYLPSPGNSLAPWTDRRPTMAAFCRFLRTRQKPLVVETGCQRGDNDFGAGMSTTLFGHVLGGIGGRLISVDNNPGNVAFARSRTRQLPVEVFQADSRDWLRRYDGPPIDALYLDSADVGTPGFEECCRQEAELALPHLAPDARILIDDTVRSGESWRGKGTLAIPWLEARGWQVERDGYQVLLRRVRG